MISKISSNLIFAICVCLSYLAYYKVSVPIMDTGRRFPLQLACTNVNKVTLINLCTENVKPVFEGPNSDGCRVHY